jgi:hypothetical protein
MNEPGLSSPQPYHPTALPVVPRLHDLSSVASVSYTPQVLDQSLHLRGAVSSNPSKRSFTTQLADLNPALPGLVSCIVVHLPPLATSILLACSNFPRRFPSQAMFLETTHSSGLGNSAFPFEEGAAGPRPGRGGPGKVTRSSESISMAQREQGERPNELL